MQALEADSLSDNLIRSIEEMIRRGEILPGECLPPHPILASRFGVGLSTVREAIKALSLIGMVEVRAGRGTRVMPRALRVLNDATAVQASLGEVEARELYEARALIETTLTRLAAERATPDDLQAIAATVDEMKAGLDDDEAFLRADRRFHLAVARAAQNRVLAQLYYISSSLLSELIQRAVMNPGEKERGLHHQEEMLQAIATHDAERAEQCAVEHMRSFANALRAGGYHSNDWRLRRPETPPVHLMEGSGATERGGDRGGE